MARISNSPAGRDAVNETDLPDERMSARKIRRLLWRIVRAVAMGYVLLAIGLFFFQSRLVYFPKSELIAAPDDYGLAFEDVSLLTADDVKLHGWFIPAGKPRGAVLFCHGNGGNISYRLDTLKILHEMGLSVLIFDYRGYGRSDGAPSERGTYLDAQAAWDFLTKDKLFAPGSIIIHGRSLGGAIAAHLAKDNLPAGLIVESSFSSATDIGVEKLPFMPARLLSRFDYNTVEFVKRVKCPVLVIHSADDRLIGIDHGRRVYAAANEPKTFVEISGSHNEGFMKSYRRYVAAMRRFTDSVLASGQEE